MTLSTFDEIVTLLIVVLGGLGILFMFFPRAVIFLNRLGNKILFRDEVILSRLRTAGLGLVVLSVIIILNIWNQL